MTSSSWFDSIIKEYDASYINMKKIVISDCDGILTDGNMSYDYWHKTFKTYGCHDKEMYNLARMLGWEFAFVTDDASGYDITNSRVSSSLHQEVIKANWKEREKLVEKYKSQGYLVVFLGDSPSDLNAASAAHVSATTANCFEPIKEYFHYVSEFQGGHGGFADILYELVKLTEEQLKIYM